MLSSFVKVVNHDDYYKKFNGHNVNDLKRIIKNARNLLTNFVFLLGDSSLDNKYWISKTSKPIGCYKSVLKGLMKQDVCYFINKELDRQNKNYCCINTAVEGSTISDRIAGKLLTQDLVAKENLTRNDVIVVNVGGNDIALKPTQKTLISLNTLLKTKDFDSIHFDHFKNLFKDQLQKYINNICSITKPKMIIICMIYYPNENSKQKSWANQTLSSVQYDTNPGILQEFIRNIYKECISKIQIKGTIVKYLPLYKTLNGKTSKDYVERVEPSEIGGKKIAKAIVDKIKYKKYIKCHR